MEVRYDAELEVSGCFDVSAAERLSASLAALGPDASVLVDLSRARDVSEVALAVLGAAAARHRLVALRGLTRHHRRILRYLGIAVDDGLTGDATLA